MTAEEFVTAVFLKATGKKPSFGPGHPKWDKILGIGNFYIDQWARERGVDWHSLYSVIDSGTVSATDTFDLDSEIRKISLNEDDLIRVKHLDGSYTDYETVPRERLKRYSYGNYVAQAGRLLVFSREFTEQDPQFGGTIQVPGYLHPRHLEDSSDEVPVDDPNWLVLISAAEFIRNDITRQNQYGNLTAEANEAMTAMKDDNGAQNTDAQRSWNPMGWC